MVEGIQGGMNKPKYILERWEHGWLVCGVEGARGVPMGALNECAPIFEKHSVVFAGIARHYNVTGKGEVVIAVATEKDGMEWKAEIEKEIESFPAQIRWWSGTYVGLSSAAIFAVLADMPYSAEAAKYSQGATPADAADLWRCQYLLNRMQTWECKLNLVAEAYPNTAWPKIIARWEELKHASTQEKNQILQECSWHENPN